MLVQCSCIIPCQRSLSQSSTASFVITLAGPRLPRTSDVTGFPIDTIVGTMGTARGPGAGGAGGSVGRSVWSAEIVSAGTAVIVGGGRSSVGGFSTRRFLFCILFASRATSVPTAADSAGDGNLEKIVPLLGSFPSDKDSVLTSMGPCSAIGKYPPIMHSAIQHISKARKATLFIFCLDHDVIMTFK